MLCSSAGVTFVLLKEATAAAAASLRGSVVGQYGTVSRWRIMPGGKRGSADQPGIGWYLPAELILYRKNLRWTESPWESNRIGSPRIVAGSFVFLIAASTLARLGVWLDMQPAAIASSTTCVAAKVGGPDTPKNPCAFAAATIAASAGSAVMSVPNEDT